MIWKDKLYKKFVEREANPEQCNYCEPYLDGDPLELEDFITSLLKKQSDNILNQFTDMEGIIDIPLVISLIKSAPKE